MLGLPITCIGTLYFSLWLRPQRLSPSSMPFIMLHAVNSFCLSAANHLLSLFSQSWFSHIVAGMFGWGEYAAVLMLSISSLPLETLLSNPMKNAQEFFSGMASSFNISFKPDWKGTWKYSHAIGVSATASTTLKLMYQGWDVTKQRHSKHGTDPAVHN